MTFVDSTRGVRVRSKEQQGLGKAEMGETDSG